MKEAYRFDKFKDGVGQNSKHYMPPCQLANSEKTNILEALNISLFQLNNEDINQNLKTTG